MTRIAVPAIAAAFVVVLHAAACAAPPEAPTAQDGAAYLGLVAGSTLHFVDGAATEEWQVATSGAFAPTGLAVDVLARRNGFVVQDRSLALEITPDSVNLLRFEDCIASCATAASPIPFLHWPLVEGDSVTGSSMVTRVAGSTETGSVQETHTTVVGLQQQRETPAGTFSGFPVTWTRTRDGVSDNALLFIAPDDGIIAFDAFDDAQLQRAP